MPELNQTQYCVKCQEPLSGRFCSQCGQPQKPKRIDGAYILAEVGSVLNFDKGILYTIRELLLRPGSTIKRFVEADRGRIVKPIIYILLSSLIYTLLQRTLKFQDAYMNYSFEEDALGSIILRWVSQNYGYANIVVAIFIAFWIKVFFRKYGYNFFELLVLSFFILGTAMYFFTLAGIVDLMVPNVVADKIVVIGVLHLSWAIGRFFGKKFIHYVKGLLCYILGLISFIWVILTTALFIEYFSR
jgi:hypothetical protein